MALLTLSKKARQKTKLKTLKSSLKKQAHLSSSSNVIDPLLSGSADWLVVSTTGLLCFERLRFAKSVISRFLEPLRVRNIVHPVVDGLSHVEEGKWLTRTQRKNVFGKTLGHYHR